MVSSNNVGAFRRKNISWRFKKFKKSFVIACVAGAAYLFYFTDLSRGTGETGRRPPSQFPTLAHPRDFVLRHKKPVPVTQASSVNLGKTSLLICQVKKHSDQWILASRDFFCIFMLFNFVFFRWIVSIFVSDCVIVKTSKIISVIGSTVTVKLTKL